MVVHISRLYVIIVTFTLFLEEGLIVAIECTLRDLRNGMIGILNCLDSSISRKSLTEPEMIF